MKGQIFSGLAPKRRSRSCGFFGRGARGKRLTFLCYLVAFLACNPPAYQVNKSVLAAIAYLCI